MTTTQMREFARIGAETRLKAIADERLAILRAFPNLGNGSAPATGTAASAARVSRTRGGMSPAQRKAVGERMRAYWAKRRGEKAGTGALQSDTAETRAAAIRKATSQRKSMSPGRRAQAEKMRAYWAARRAARRAVGEAVVSLGTAARSHTRRKTARKK